MEIRRQLIEENRLDAVISMPSGVFRPYAGVSAAVLLFTKGASTENVWFYDMEHDGFSLDDKRQRVARMISLTFSSVGKGGMIQGSSNSALNVSTSFEKSWSR